MNSKLSYLGKPFTYNTFYYCLGESWVGAHSWAGTRVSGQQAHAQNREARDRDIQQTEHPRPTQEREGSTREYTRTRTRRLVGLFYTSMSEVYLNNV